jgi:hypothetical protein
MHEWPIEATEIFNGEEEGRRRRRKRERERERERERDKFIDNQEVTEGR